MYVDGPARIVLQPLVHIFNLQGESGAELFSLCGNNSGCWHGRTVQYKPKSPRRWHSWHDREENNTMQTSDAAENVNWMKRNDPGDVMNTPWDHVAYIFGETWDVPDAAAAAIAFVLARHPRRRNRCKNDFSKSGTRPSWPSVKVKLTHTLSLHTYHFLFTLRLLVQGHCFRCV